MNGDQKQNENELNNYYANMYQCMLFSSMYYYATGLTGVNKKKEGTKFKADGKTLSEEMSFS